LKTRNLTRPEIKHDKKNPIRPSLTRNLRLPDIRWPEIWPDSDPNDPKFEMTWANKNLKHDPIWPGMTRDTENRIMFDLKSDMIRIELILIWPVAWQYFSQTYPIWYVRTRPDPTRLIVTSIFVMSNKAIGVSIIDPTRRVNLTRTWPDMTQR
jgi:hypothetical protein